MEWITPKTDWKVRTDEQGKYVGDYFGIEDYNRIKNNIQFLHTLAVKMYENFKISDMGDDKGYADYPYADEINIIENNLEILAENTFRKNYGKKQVYVDNGRFIDHEELNRIESVLLDMYNRLTGQYNGRRMLAFMFGSREAV